MIASETLRALNEALARIPLSERQIAELPIELDQLASAAESVRPLLEFDGDPSRFTAILEYWAWTE